LSFRSSTRCSRCFTCSGPLKLSTVSKPSMPLALVASGTLCQAESCSTLTHVTHALLKPQLGWAEAFSFLAASKTSGQVLGGFSGSSPAFLKLSLLYHITVLDELNGNDSMSPFTVE